MKRSITFLALLLAVFNMYAEDCEPPAGLTVETVSETEALLSWEPLANASAYRLKIEDANDNPSDLEIEITVFSNSYLATGLIPGTSYKFKVRTVCGNDRSDWTNWLFFWGGGGDDDNGGDDNGDDDNGSDDDGDDDNGDDDNGSDDDGDDDNGDATADCVAPQDLSVTENGDGSITLSWSSVTGAVAYEVEVEDGNYTPPFELEVLTGETSLTVDGLVEGGQYKFKVKSKCGDGVSSEYSAWVFFTVGAGNGNGGDDPGVCAIPEGLSVTDHGDGSVTLSWSSVTGAVAYEVEVEDGNNTLPFNLEVLTAETSLMVDGLVEDGQYKFKVKSKCGDGVSSEYSVWVFFTVGAGNGNGGDDPGVCAIPEGLSVTDHGDGSVTLSWSSVTGAAAYEVEVEDANDGTSDFSFTELVTGTSVMVVDLTPGGSYQFKVKTQCNGTTSSDYSGWFFFTIDPMAANPGIVNLTGGVPETEQDDSGLNSGTVQSVEVIPYPNPARDMLTLDVVRAPESMELDIQVFDAAGRRVWRRETTGGAAGSIRIPVAQWQPGLYQVVLISHDLYLNKKVMVAH